MNTSLNQEFIINQISEDAARDILKGVECPNFKIEPDRLQLMCDLAVELAEDPNIKYNANWISKALTLDITNPGARLVCKAMMEYQYLSIKHFDSDKLTPNMVKFLEILIPITKAIALQLVPTFGIVGVQPMTGPVDMISALQATEDPDISDGVRRIELSLVTHPIEAKSYPLNTKISFAELEILQNLHNIDIKQQTVDVVSQEVSHHITSKILDDLMELSGRHQRFKVELFNFDTALQVLPMAINKVSNQIAIDTKRNVGSFMVTSPEICNYLRASIPFLACDDTNSLASPMRLIGTLNGLMDVYCSSHVNKNKILIGYKGYNEIDAGYWFAPRSLVSGYNEVDETIQLETLGSYFSYNGGPISSSDYYCTLEVNLDDLGGEEINPLNPTKLDDAIEYINNEKEDDI